MSDHVILHDTASESYRSIHKDLVRVKFGYYRLGKVHFLQLGVPLDPCEKCGGTGRDPVNRRRHCRTCHNKKEVEGPTNAAVREGYRIGRTMVGARNLEDAVRDVELREIDYTRETALAYFFT